MNPVCPLAGKKGIIGNNKNMSRKKCNRNEDGVRYVLLQNIGTYLPNYMASHARRFVILILTAVLTSNPILKSMFNLYIYI